MALWHRHAWIAYSAVFIGMLGHGSSEFVSVLSGISGPELSVWRFLLGSAGLVVISLCLPASRDLLKPLRERPFTVIALSLVGVSLGYLVFHWSLDFASIVQVATIVTIAPIFVGITNLLLNGQPIGAPKMVTGLAAFFGGALLITDGYLDRLAGSAESLVGVFMAIGSAAIIGSFAVFIRPVIGEYGALRMTTLTLTIGGIGLWLLVGIAWGIWVNPLTLLDREPGQAGAVVALALWNTTLTQWLWIGGLAAVPDITRGMYMFFLKPIVAAVLALYFLAQPISVLQWVAIAIICAAVAIEALWSRRLQRAGVSAG